MKKILILIIALSFFAPSLSADQFKGVKYADMNMMGKSFALKLSECLSYGDLGCIDLFLFNGFDINNRIDEEENTLLHAAVQVRSYHTAETGWNPADDLGAKVIVYILDRAPSLITEVNTEGESVMHMLVRQDFDTHWFYGGIIIAAMSNLGQDILGFANKKGNTAFVEAACNGGFKWMEFLMMFGYAPKEAEIKKAYKAAKAENNVEMMEYLEKNF